MLISVTQSEVSKEAGMLQIEQHFIMVGGIAGSFPLFKWKELPEIEH